MICAECNGSGKITGFFPVYDESVPAEKRNPTIQLTCLLCDGKGIIPEGYKDRALRGENSRRIRIENELSLREFCTRFPVSISQLSKYERGCDLPDKVIYEIESALKFFDKQ